MSTWPSYADVVANNFRFGRDRDGERTAREAGLVRQETRVTAAPRTRQTTALVHSDADRKRFETWADEHASAWFAFHDPDDGQEKRVRVREGSGGITYTARVVRNRRRWEISLVLEGWQ